MSARCCGMATGLSWCARVQRASSTPDPALGVKDGHYTATLRTRDPGHRSERREEESDASNPGKSKQMKVRVDPDVCQGHTLCAMAAPEAFELSDFDGHSTARFEDVPVELEEAVRKAAATCPEQAIVISE
jgi:ferredoxin